MVLNIIKGKTFAKSDGSTISSEKVFAEHKVNECCISLISGSKPSSNAQKRKKRHQFEAVTVY